MGQQIGGAVLSLGGRLLGGAIGGPIGAAVGGLAGGLIGSMLFGRSAKPLIQDYQLANSSFGRPIPLIYGQWRLPGTVIWESNIQTVSGSAGGKGALGGATVYKYYQSAAFAFCQGPARLLKVWLDGKLFYDATSAFPVELVKEGKFTARVYTGTEDQLPDPLIQEWVVGNVDPPLACPAYRGTAYFVAQQIELDLFGNRMPNFTAAWATDVQDKVLYTQMIPLANDIAFQPSATTGYPYAVLVSSLDWSGLRYYVLDSESDSVRVFDIRTGVTLQYATWAQMFAPNPAPAPANPTINLGSITSTIAAVPGGDVYIASGVNYAGPPTVWTLDPNTLKVINTITLPSNPTSGGAWIWQLIPFQLVSPLGAFDMLVRLDVQYMQVLVFNPADGTHSAWLPVHWAGFDGWTTVVVGAQDTTAGTVELWVLSSNFFGDDTAYIYKITVVSDDPSAITPGSPYFQQMAIITAADMGYTGTGWIWASPTIAYDPSDNSLVITNSFNNRSAKWSPAAGIVWSGSAVQGNNISPGALPDLSAGLLGSGGFGGFSVADTSSGSITPITSSPFPFEVDGYYSPANAVAFSVNSVITSQGNTQFWIAYLQRVAASEIPISAILLDLCERAGIDGASVDVSEVWQTTGGYALTEEKAYGAAIADLCQIYQIDMVESDYKLKFVPRGLNGPVATITQDDLAAIDSDQAHFWQAKRAIEQELPLQINVRYYDPEIDYQTGASYAKRIALPVPTVFSKRVKTVDLPLVITNAEAHQIAETWLYTMWAERETYQTKTGQKYLWLDPTDNVTVTLDNGDTYTVRLEKEEIGDDYSLKLELASEDEDTYTPSLTGPASISQGVQTITQSPTMQLLQFNIPLLQDADDLGGAQLRGYYAAAPNAAVTATNAATLYESTDGGTSWPSLGNLASFANWGYGQSEGILGDTPSIFATDTVNTVTLSLAPGSTVPASITYAQLMNGGNVAIVGQEIIQFQTATHNADGTVTLSTLLRGRRGTDWATGTHAAGERIVFNESAGDVQSVALALTQLGQPELWKLVPSGRFIDSTTAQPFTYLGYDLMPYAPCNFARALSGSDLVITWVRRSRLGGGDGVIIDTTDTVPLAEAAESYQIFLLANASSIDNFSPTDPTTFVRSFPASLTATPRVTLNTPAVTYTADMMAADGFDPGTDTLYVVGYQLSAVVGRGFRAYAVLPVPVLIASAVVGPPALITLTPASIPSTGTIGIPALSGGLTGPTITISPRSVASTEGIGMPTLSGPGIVVPTIVISPASIPSAEREGFPVISVAGGTTGGGGTGGGTSTGSFKVPMQNRSLYYLTNVNPASVAPVAGDFQVVVVDPTSDGGTGDTFWTAAQVASMRNPAGGIVVAYFDMGGAEDYRNYYAQAKAAGILSSTVNSWGENSVEYWSSTWQSIAQAWAAKAIASGFDGIYLDVADCYTDPWCISRAPAGGGYAAGTQQAAGWWEIQFMQTLKTWCQTQKPGFQLWENAGEGLSDTTQFGSSPRFVDVIDGALREQVIYLYPGNGNTPASGTVPIITDLSPDYANLSRIIAAGKPVTLTEYVGAGGNAIGGGTVKNAGVASLNNTVVGSGVTNAIHWVRTVCAAWNCGYYISVADYNVSDGPTLSVVDTEGITTP